MTFIQESNKIKCAFSRSEQGRVLPPTSAINVTLLAFAAERRAAKRRAAAPLLLGTRAFQFGQKKVSIRFDSTI